MEKKTKSEAKSKALIGNQRAKLGTHPSMVMRLPVGFVDGLYKCLEAEEFPDAPNKRDVLEYALSVLRQHIETKTGELVHWPFIHEDEDALGDRANGRIAPPTCTV